MKKCPFRRGVVTQYYERYGTADEYEAVDNLECMGDECMLWDEDREKCALASPSSKLVAL